MSEIYQNSVFALEFVSVEELEILRDAYTQKIANVENEIMRLGNTIQRDMLHLNKKDLFRRRRQICKDIKRRAKCYDQPRV